MAYSYSEHIKLFSYMCNTGYLWEIPLPFLIVEWLTVLADRH